MSNFAKAVITGITLASVIVLLCPVVSSAESKQTRLALVIANSDYARARPLPGAARDAKNITDILVKLDFKVSTEKNMTRSKITAAVGQFKKTLREAGSNSIGFLYYAGHGGADREHSDNFLLPIDAEVRDLVTNGLSVRAIQQELQQLADVDNHPAAVIVVIDACRSLSQSGLGRNSSQDATMKGDVSAMTSMAEPEAGYLLAFSTSKNQNASDEGDFAQSLIKHIQRSGLTVAQVFEEVQRDVYAKTNQFPVYQSSIAAKICLVSCESGTAGASQAEFRMNKAMEHRDGSSQGQVAAIESLLALGYTYENSDLSGISLKGANLSSGIFKAAKLHAVDLSMVVGEKVNLSASGLRFSRLDHGKFNKADISTTYAPFLSGRSASFNDGNLARANFFAAELQDAKFINANLRGASFAFADLREANFDEADLTDASFTGAVLDGASFKNSKIKNTDVLGARMRNADLTKLQKQGTCRNNVFADDLLDWNVRLIEKWESSKYTKGYDFEDLLTSRWGFKNFSDRSLPLCTATPNPAVGYDSRFPAQQDMHLDRSYMSKANRREEFRKRVENHVKFLASSLSPAQNLVGDGIQVEGWQRYIQATIETSEIVSGPHINTDLLLVTFLKAGLINLEKVNWKNFASLRHMFERNVREKFHGKFLSHSMWGPIFPPDAPWNNLPEEIGDLYRSWVQFRANTTTINKIIFHPPFYIAPNTTVASLKTGYLYTTAEELTTMNSWPGDSVTRVTAIVNDLRKTIFLPVALHEAGIARSLLVFPAPYDRYEISIPQGLIKEYGIKNHIEADIEMEIELHIEKIELIPGRDSIALVFVTPAEVHLTKHGKSIWLGKVQVVGGS